jgi:arginine/ornithine N-succinyltransferase beta subunit
MMQQLESLAPLLRATAAPNGKAATARRGPTEGAGKFRFLVARPAARADLAGMMEIAGSVNLASMRGEEEKNRLAIEQSARTLGGALPWQQGLLLLGADLFPAGGGPAELAGNVKLQVGWGGCWKKTRHARLFNFPGLQTWAEHEYLTYQPNDPDEYTLELAGLSVLPRHRGKSVARFLSEAWALFVLLYRDELRRQVGTIASLFANVLTADAGGRYPFYEQVVRPLFGGLDYDTVDAYRYARCDARSPILDEFLDARGEQPRARILCQLLPDALRQGLGQVRDQSVGCQRNLERLGFSRTDKYDVLDGGQYFETTLDRLDRTTQRREYPVRCVREDEFSPDSPMLTVAPAGRPMQSFRCARTACGARRDELLLGQEVYETLRLGRHERVVALTAQAAARE